MSLKLEVEKLKQLLKPKPKVMFTFDAKDVKEGGSVVWVVFSLNGIGGS